MSDDEDSGDFKSMTESSEKAKKAFIEKKFGAAVKLYNEGLASLPSHLLSILEIFAKTCLQEQDYPKAAALAAFLLRLKPAYFEALVTYADAVKSTNSEAAKTVLKNYLEKDGTDEEAKRLLDSITDSPTPTDNQAFSLSVGHLNVPDDFVLIGNVLNNVALCEMKLGHFAESAASASQALLFLNSADGRTKALFRLANALFYLGHVTDAENVTQVAKEEGMKNAELKKLSFTGTEAKGKHNWGDYLKKSLKDEMLVLDCAEYLSPKVAVGGAGDNGFGLVAAENIERGEVLCVQRAVHFLGAKSDADEIDHHLQFPKEVLAKVLADPLMERAVRLLHKKGTPLADKENVPSMGQAFRRLPVFLPFMYDQLPLSQIRMEVKEGKSEASIKTFEGTPDYETRGRKLADAIGMAIKRAPRFHCLALTFEDRYKKTMTQGGDDTKQLAQLGLWIMPSLLHHADRPSTTVATLGGVAVVTAIRDVAPGEALTAMFSGIQCLPDRLKQLRQMGVVAPAGHDVDSLPASATIKKGQEAFNKANSLKMETMGLDQSEGAPFFEKAIDVCLNTLKDDREILEQEDPLGLAALYFTMADCLGGKKELAGMCKAYFMGIQAAHKAIVFNLETLTRMTKLQKFIPMAKKIEEMQNQAEEVAKANPSLQEEFKKIKKFKDIGPSVATIREFLEDQLPVGCRLIFGTSDALSLLN